MKHRSNLKREATFDMGYAYGRAGNEFIRFKETKVTGPYEAGVKLGFLRHKRDKLEKLVLKVPT